MNFRILGAILKKDVLSHAPIVAVVAALFFADALITRLDLVPLWTSYKTPVVLAALTVLLLSVFQNDSPTSLKDDWLCRPVPRAALLAAKLVLVSACVYLPRAIGTLLADLGLGLPWAESLLDAVLLQDGLILYLLPVLLFTAIVTRNLVQGFGVLFAILLCVFVIPTPFVRPPGPLSPGIREEFLNSGMLWLGTMPAFLVSLVLLVAGFRLLYWRRRVVPARLLMALTVFITVLMMLLPMQLAPWSTAFAIQAASGPAPQTDPARIQLRNMRACFPAARRMQAADPAFGASLWEDEALRGVGPDSVAFLTAIEARGLPLDWRAKLNHVRAEYTANGGVSYTLRPARYITDDDGHGSLTHAWLLPDGALQRLRDAQPRLELTYSLSLLKPREYRLPTDGRRRALPGLGYCSAEVDEPGNRIDVDCFSAFARSAQISAELNGIPASRVLSQADFAPAPAQWPFGERVKLTIGSPRLARHESITVTSWEAAGFFEKSLSLPGILGAELGTCPLPTTGPNGFQQASWRDAAPHAAHSVGVDANVQLEVLDFGSEGTPDGPAMLLLPGLGATAHSYDELAPLLAQRHRVVAMTRRGTGYSSKPDFGFDTPRLAQDVLQVMDAMGLEKVVLVGHSIAGEELTWLGAHHPDRFLGLVYLDAAYDRSGDPEQPDVLRLREINRALPPEPPFPSLSLLNFAAMTQTLLDRGHVRIPEGELIAFLRVNDPLLAGVPSIDARTQQAIRAAVQAPDYAALKVPALAIYAQPDPAAALPPWFDPNDEELMAKLAERSRIAAEMKRSSIELFRKNAANSQILELRDATHYIIQSNQDQVLEALERFAGKLDPPNSPSSR